MAKILDSSANYIGRLEHGQHSPSLEKIENIAKILDIQAFKLFMEKEKYNLPNRVNLKGWGKMKLNKIFGNNLKYFRFKKKYTQEHLAELTGMSVTYISQLEAGMHSPSFEKIECLAEVLQVKAFEFYIERDFIVLPARVDMKL